MKAWRIAPVYARMLRGLPFYATYSARTRRTEGKCRSVGNEMHSSVYGNTRWFIIIIFIIVMRVAAAHLFLDLPYLSCVLLLCQRCQHVYIYI